MARPFGSAVSLAANVLLQLQMLVRAASTPQSLAFRCRIILRAGKADDPSNLQVANELGCNRTTVARWRERFVLYGLAGLQDLPRSGRPRSFSPLATC
jgi:transposase